MQERERAPQMSFSEWQQNKEIIGGEENSFTSSVAFVRLESAFWGEDVWTQSSLAVCAEAQSSPTSFNESENSLLYCTSSI